MRDEGRPRYPPAKPPLHSQSCGLTCPSPKSAVSLGNMPSRAEIKEPRKRALSRIHPERIALLLFALSVTHFVIARASGPQMLFIEHAALPLGCYWDRKRVSASGRDGYTLRSLCSMAIGFLRLYGESFRAALTAERPLSPRKNKRVAGFLVPKARVRSRKRGHW
ncbi:hypothetical protein CC78DRAFT_585383 [Lojkania enalia]|uniref:Uncharacterized protein n=1 Tax=Lojkania enalia TaxID=147567 RepID=A0A9P4K5S0_9PLEO|nr:hypothetical protein CC78DRAFT_585383 [Didymosphaeria enalia]